MISHTSHEFSATARAYAILVAALDAKGVLDARDIAACLRIGAVETGGVVGQLQEIMATVVTNTIERYERDGPSALSIVE